MEAVLFRSSSDNNSISSHKSPTVRTHKNQASNFQSGILPSPLINHSLSSYPPLFSSHQKQPQPPLLPLPGGGGGPSLVRNSSIKPVQNPLVRGFSLPPINTKPKKNCIASNYSSLIAPRKSTSSSLSTAKSAASDGFSKDAVSAGGGSRSMCHVQGTRSMNNPSKIEQVLSPKLLNVEIDNYNVGDFWGSVVFTLSPPPSSLPMPSFSILKPKPGCRY